MNTKSQNVRKKCIFPNCQKEARSVVIPYCSAFHNRKMRFIKILKGGGYTMSKTDEEIYEIMKGRKRR